MIYRQYGIGHNDFSEKAEYRISVITDSFGVYSAMKNAIEVLAEQAIKQIIINPPATIIIWRDGTKTVCKSNEEYDPEVGVAMCIAKKYFGSRNQFTKAVKEAMKDFEGRTWV